MDIKKTFSTIALAAAILASPGCMWSRVKVNDPDVVMRSHGITVSRMNVATLEHHLEFDSSGKLVKQETHGSVPSGARWSINPFD